jgi:hypothetical protein
VTEDPEIEALRERLAKGFGSRVLVGLVLGVGLLLLLFIGIALDYADHKFWYEVVK